jgi:hypothetical protein
LPAEPDNTIAASPVQRLISAPNLKFASEFAVRFFELQESRHWISEDKTMREDHAVGSALEIKGPAKQVIGVGAVVVTLLALSLAMITIWAQMIIAL